RISDKGLNAWLDTNNDTAKAILFSDKGTTSALIKVLATEYLDRIAFAQIRNKESTANEMFGITSYPTLIVLPGGTSSPTTFSGAFSKSAMKEWLDQYASPSKSKSAPKPKKEQIPLADDTEPPAAAAAQEDEAIIPPTPAAESEEAFSSASASQASEEASTAIPSTDETVDPTSQPTESPDPNVVDDETPKPAPMPDLPPPIPSLIERSLLEKTCLGPKTTTCILALLPPASGPDAATLPADATAALASLAEIREKHNERGGKLFPFFSIPAANEGQGVLKEALKLSDKDIELVA
ncbi:MAG: hypothetical protein Q9180_010002, partial [Flavoplaca navasiana]